MFRFLLYYGYIQILQLLDYVVYVSVVIVSLHDVDVEVFSQGEDFDGQSTAEFQIYVWCEAGQIFIKAVPLYSSSITYFEGIL